MYVCTRSAMMSTCLKRVYKQQQSCCIMVVPSKQSCQNVPPARSWRAVHFQWSCRGGARAPSCELSSSQSAATSSSCAYYSTMLYPMMQLLRATTRTIIRMILLQTVVGVSCIECHVQCTVRISSVFRFGCIITS